MSQKTDNKNEKDNKSKPAVKPEPETLHTTDPQEHMEGPVSSLMHGTGKKFDTEETRKEADKEKDDDM